MAETVPQAATVRTLRWGLAVAIRFWCLLHLAAVVLGASEAWNGAATTSWVSPSGAIAPRWDAALVEAMQRGLDRLYAERRFPVIG